MPKSIALARNKKIQFESLVGEGFAMRCSSMLTWIASLDKLNCCLFEALVTGLGKWQ